MAARTTREAARERMRAAFEAAMDQVIPADAATPLRGRTFGEWEDQADAFDQTLTTILERARGGGDPGAASVVDQQG